MGLEAIKRKGYSKSLNKEELWDIYKSMKTQRLLEERLLKLYKGGQLLGAVYPGIGQEASMAGIGAGMGKNDIFGGTHRDFSMVDGLEGCLRVTVGTRNENDLFIEALGEILK